MIETSPILAGTEPARPVFELLERAASTFPDRTALNFDEFSLSYADTCSLVNKVANGLQQRGVVKGTRVGLCLPNCIYSVIFYYAILKSGGIVVNFNPLYVEKELRGQIDDSGTTIMVTVDVAEIFLKIKDVLDGSCLESIIVCPMNPAVSPKAPLDVRITPIDALIGEGLSPIPVIIDPEKDIAVLQYTGGTTGVPKGAMLTHGNIWSNAAQINMHIPRNPECQDRILGVLPLFHAFAMTVVMNLGISRGAEIILVPKFSIDDLVAVIAQKRPTIFPGVPTIYTALNAAAVKAGVDLSSIRFCISGGAPLPIEVRQQFEQLTACRLVEGYGLSEASPVVTCNPFDREPKEGSIGVAVEGTTVELRDPANPSELVPEGKRGEICVRGPQVMAGYWRRPAESEDVFVDGALRTGDIGYRDHDGFYYIVDRIKDIIICSGYNVYPRIIEDALYQHPSILEAVVVGVPDSYRGQSPKAFVRLREGIHSTEEELLAFLATQISRVEIPKSIEIRTELPRTAVGKLSRLALLEEYKHNDISH